MKLQADISNKYVLTAMKTSDTTTLHVRSREQMRKKAQKLLIDKQLPGNVFGQGEDSQPIAVSARELTVLLEKQGDSGFFYVEGEGVVRTPVMISEIQRNSLTGQAIHIALQRINLKQKVASEVAIELVGELDIKEATAILVRNFLEVEALPQDLPETFEVDISQFKAVGDAVYVKDLGIDLSKVTVLLSEEEMSDPIVLVKEVREEVIEEEPTPADGEATAESTEAAADAASDGENDSKSE